MSCATLVLPRPSVGAICRPDPDVAHLHAALDGVAAGLLSFDRTFAVLHVNARLIELLGLPVERLRRCDNVLSVLETCSALDEVTVQQLHEAVLASVADDRERALGLEVVNGGAARSLAVQVGPLSDGRFMAAFEDVTARRAAEASAIALAMSDPLTGLCNRQLFEQRSAAMLAGAATTGAAHALLLIDLDRFKPVNDTLGHPVGDALLRLVAKRLRSVLRREDLVARLGGDEFALLVPLDPDESGAALLARRIVDVLSRPYLVDGHLVNIGASVGVTLAPRDGREHALLLRNADLALYHAKNRGRAAFSFFAVEMDAVASARRLLEIDLRKALALGQFELHYQPQVELEQDSVVGFEALLRWRHPERGLVSPAEFVPLAEEIGLIVALGEWVLREATREATCWPDDVSVAVNVSPHQFENADRLVDMVGNALTASGLPGRRLELEITESVLLRNEASVLAALHRIRALGVRVAMDDFGTGYSSLSQLHSFPFDKIKIDRSFVRELGNAAGQDAIIRAITGLGVSLGMSTIAEGVETLEQLARIRTEGCTSVQGYLFSRPVPAQQIRALIADFTARRIAARHPIPQRER